MKIETEYRNGYQNEDRKVAPTEDRQFESPVMPESALATTPATSVVSLRTICACRGVRALAWDGEVLYAGFGYNLIRWRARANERRRRVDVRWESVASFNPGWWRNLTSRARLSSRLVRDGFHALAILRDPSEPRPEDQRTDDQRTKDQQPANQPLENRNNKAQRTLIAAVPGAIVTRVPGSDEFRVTHEIRRGTRPLHITAVPDGTVYWGEYFDNRERAEVHIFASADRGESWQIAYTFPARAIRHIHNIVYDRWGGCLWILTGDDGHECKVLRASCDLRSVEIVLSGNQQARAVAAIPMPDALYLATDTPFEANHVLRLRRDGRVDEIAPLASSSIFGCRVREAMFFSTMVEPSAVNARDEVHLVGSANAGSADQSNWQVLARWTKDKWPMRYFQYGNAMLPDGENLTNYLAATAVAVEQDDQVTTLWQVGREVSREVSGATNRVVTREASSGFENRPQAPKQRPFPA
ncbi:MAG: hypothetical protein WCC32_09875 [Terriglobales bacterium]